MSQAPSSVFMVRPDKFGFNAETAESNAFQEDTLIGQKSNIREDALKEFDAFVRLLKEKDIEVYVFPSPIGKEAPDAVFPNNWVSFHHDGRVILYPMLAENRRIERRKDIIDDIGNDFQITNWTDISKEEENGRILEGTGSIVFDHVNRTAYANASPRTNGDLFRQVCTLLDYEPVFFQAVDEFGMDIYHTNVVMNIGKGFAVICAESVVSSDRERVLRNLQSGGLDIVEITYEQMKNFGGNMIQLQNNKGIHFLVMSKAAFAALTEKQKETLQKYAQFICPDLSTIESVGGGSARCMISGIHLPKKRK